MNLQEFAALKPGDKIASPMNGSSIGEITSTNARGVSVVWGPRHEREKPFTYVATMTAWMHWNKVVDGAADQDPQ